MAGVNFVKHLRRLANKRDRLKKRIERWQRELDAVNKQLAAAQAAIGAPAPVFAAEDATSLAIPKLPPDPAEAHQ